MTTTAISPRTYTLRQFQPGDQEQIRSLFIETHLHAAAHLPERLLDLCRIAIAGEISTKLGNIRDAYAAHPNHAFIASPDDAPGQVAGFCALVRQDSRRAELKNVVVSPVHQGQGLATMLMKAFEETAKRDGYEKAVLWTYQHLEIATAMYRRRGYVEGPLTPHTEMIMELQPLYMELDLSDRR